jgi:hypothetical protein
MIVAMVSFAQFRTLRGPQQHVSCLCKSPSDTDLLLPLSGHLPGSSRRRCPHDNFCDVDALGSGIGGDP